MDSALDMLMMMRYTNLRFIIIIIIIIIITLRFMSQNSLSPASCH